MYFDTNFKTMAAAKAALAAAKENGEPGLLTFQPGPFPARLNGQATAEGPHSPQPHKWYASITLVDGYAVAIK